MEEGGNNQLLGNGDGGDDDIFVYTGGEQEVPRDVRRAKIDESIDTIPQGAFSDYTQLIEVEGHNKLKKIEAEALNECHSLRRLSKMEGVIEIEMLAFHKCHALSDLELDKLKIIRDLAFNFCRSLRSVNLPSVNRIGTFSFHGCGALTDAVFGEDLEGIESYAFYKCPSLRRIAIPLNYSLIVEGSAFHSCESLSRVDVIGEIHTAISSLHLESWRDEMMEEIDRINQILPDTRSSAKTVTIRQWIRSVIDRMEQYKREHKVLLKEATLLLELALWKAKLLNEEGMQCKADEEKKPKKAKIDAKNSRKEHRVTCGANIVIKNVLPFLALKK